MTAAPLVFPAPYFGGKRDAAAAVWERFGKVANFVEPFCGSCAVLLGRPDEPGVETVNDLDGFLVNALRAIATDPSEVAYYADWPVSELDLQARHAYLVKRTPWLVDRLGGDPSWCDPKLAGWWIWGACAWIGSGWCSGSGPWVERDGVLVHRDQLPHLGTGGAGVNRKLPHLAAGRGVNRQLPHLGTGGAGRRGLSEQGEAVCEWLEALQSRLRGVRICCGDWSRGVTPVVTTRHGLTGVFLDPPYTEGEMEYSASSGDDVAAAAAEWCRANGDNPLLRIALCGHEGEHDLSGWEVYRWKARGGYGNQGATTRRTIGIGR